MHMRSARLGVGLTIVAAVALGGCGHGHENADAELVVREVHRERADRASYVEGAVQFVEVTAAHKQAPPEKLELGGAPVALAVEDGEYLVSSYTRTCESACGAGLDPPTLRCAMRLSVAPGERRALRVVTVVARRCRIQPDR
jgi:hypothetical protein